MGTFWALAREQLTILEHGWTRHPQFQYSSISSILASFKMCASFYGCKFMDVNVWKPKSL